VKQAIKKSFVCVAIGTVLSLAPHAGANATDPAQDPGTTTMEAPSKKSPCVKYSKAKKSKASSTRKKTVLTGPACAKAHARELVAKRGWSKKQYTCLVSLWDRESGWRTTAGRVGGSYGIPQSNPGSKMASAGSDWLSGARTQIRWGLGYIADRYKTPCTAWSHFQHHNWY